MLISPTIENQKIKCVLSKIQDFPGMLNFYHITVIQFFKSNWAEIRASAAMFIGKENKL